MSAGSRQSIGGKMNRVARRIVIMAVVVAVFAVPIAAYGVSLFEDVDDDNIFVNDINWMKITGVSKGCNPPLNTQYCPEDPVLRQEMAAFLRRLSVGEIVNAATAVQSENSDKVDGRDADDLMSITASNTDTNLQFVPDPGNPSSNPKKLIEIMDFSVPANGGVIQAHANATAEPVPLGDDSQIGFIWIEIGGNGQCPGMVSDPAGVGYYYLPRFLAPNEGDPTSPFTVQPLIDTASALATAEVPAGTTRVTLCTAALGTQELNVNAHLSVTWNPVASSAGVSTADAVSTEDLLERFASALDG